MCELTDTLLRLHRRCEETVTLTTTMKASLAEYNDTLQQLAVLLEGRNYAESPK